MTKPLPLEQEQKTYIDDLIKAIESSPNSRQMRLGILHADLRAYKNVGYDTHHFDRRYKQLMKEYGPKPVEENGENSG